MENWVATEAHQQQLPGCAVLTCYAAVVAMGGIVTLLTGPQPLALRNLPRQQPGAVRDRHGGGTHCLGVSVEVDAVCARYERVHGDAPSEGSAASFATDGCDCGRSHTLLLNDVSAAAAAPVAVVHELRDVLAARDLPAVPAVHDVVAQYAVHAVPVVRAVVAQHAVAAVAAKPLVYAVHAEDAVAAVEAERVAAAVPAALAVPAAHAVADLASKTEGHHHQRNPFRCRHCFSQGGQAVPQAVPHQKWGTSCNRGLKSQSAEMERPKAAMKGFKQAGLERGQYTLRADSAIL